VVIVDPRSNVPGEIVYVKDGNLWLQAGAQARQITNGGNDSMPTWSSDGQWIYFIRTQAATGKWPANGVIRTYDLEIPSVIRMHPDGTGQQTMLSGKIQKGSFSWQAFIRQPVPNPAGTMIAVVTDYPDPTTNDVVLKFLNLSTGGLVNPHLPEVAPLGHQDPAWAPDGSAIVYVKDARNGTRGAPVLERYDMATKTTRALTGPGYLSASWSPDGRYLAATQTGSFGTDVVILDARSGAELLRVTSDQSSFDPIWSPAGDAIAFFRVNQGVVDLELVRLQGAGPGWTLGETVPMTQSAGLDAGSRASWFIPPDQLPTPGPSLAPTVGFPTLPPSVAPQASIP
jgi:Tol biopolymer transport system component